MSEWQSIERADKADEILALMGVVFRSVARWHDDSSARNPRPYWRSERGYLFGVTWDRANQPTHWQPLPAAPKPPGDAR